MMYRSTTPLLLIGALSLGGRTHGFAPASRTGDVRIATASSRHSRNAVLLQATEEKTSPDGAKLGSVNKEIAFDAKAGRFFETGADAEDCIPSQEYCVVDESSGKSIRLTVEEKEKMFLDALQSYYATGRQVMDDTEFDSLKDDLAWNGSEVVQLDRKETKYLMAMQAYFRGEPLMNDKEFDVLRDELREDGSKIAVATEPKCYIETGICTVNFQKDEFRNNLLYLPTLSILFILWLGIGYEIVGGRINPIILGSLGAPLCISASKSITDNLIFPENLIAYGPCPSCEAENRVYFGNILGVEGFGKVAGAKCKKCKEVFNVQRRSLRASSQMK